MASDDQKNGLLEPSFESCKAATICCSSAATHKYGKKRQSSVNRPAGSEVDDIVTLLPGSDPLRLELTRLENQVRG